VWLEGLGQLKNPMTSSGIEPATFLYYGQKQGTGKEANTGVQQVSKQF
jgi:hypothetical protein